MMFKDDKYHKTCFNVFTQNWTLDNFRLGIVTGVFGAESLLHMCILQKSSNRQYVWAGVHRYEKEDTRQIEPRHNRIVLHNHVQQIRDLLDYNRIEC